MSWSRAAGIGALMLGVTAIYVGGHVCGAQGGVVEILSLILVGLLLLALGGRMLHHHRRQTEAEARLADLLAWRDTQRDLPGRPLRGRHR